MPISGLGLLHTRSWCSSLLPDLVHSPRENSTLWSFSCAFQVPSLLFLGESCHLSGECRVSAWVMQTQDVSRIYLSMHLQVFRQQP